MSVQDLGASSSNHWYPSVALEIRIQGPSLFLTHATMNMHGIFNGMHITNTAAKSALKYQYR